MNAFLLSKPNWKGPQVGSNPSTSRLTAERANRLRQGDLPCSSSRFLSRDIVDEGVARVNYCAIEIESE